MRSKDKLSLNEAAQKPSYRVRLPGFLVDDEIGMGDAIKRVTSAIGLRPCGGCEKRAAVLNRWITFSRQRATKS